MRQKDLDDIYIPMLIAYILRETSIMHSSDHQGVTILLVPKHPSVSPKIRPAVQLSCCSGLYYHMPKKEDHPATLGVTANQYWLCSPRLPATKVCPFFKQVQPLLFTAPSHYARIAAQSLV
jgi:hypothetical protein